MKHLLSALAVCLVFIGLQSSVLAENHGEPPVKELENQFNDLMNLETNEDGSIKKYESMDRLEEELKSIMVWPLADYFLDNYFYEEDDNVYYEAIDGPYKLIMDQDYRLEKISENHYKLTQKGENELRGEYTLTIEYNYEAGKWVFKDRMNHVSDGGEMPDTATSLPFMMVVGGVLVLTGIVLFTRRRNIPS